MRVAVVIGTRPELVKMATVVFALEEARAEVLLVHSGQHYDESLSGSFFRDLGLRNPDHYLGVGSGSQAVQTAACMVALEKVLLENPCDMVLVQGDTNTVLAGALTGVKMGVPVGHVEAGLRSHDRRMPEEYNRRVADHVSHLLFAPTEGSADILRGEKVWGKTFVTGNTVIDACERFGALAEEKTSIMEHVPFQEFILLTAHRAENVDDPVVLGSLVDIIENSPLPVVYPVHPRTRKSLEKEGLWARLSSCSNILLLPPAGYFDFLALMRHCRFILTDSGGIQEEATAPSIRKRVLVFRDNTERPEAVEAGYARIVGTSSENVLRALQEEMDASSPSAGSPFGDGEASRRIADIVLQEMKE